MPQRSQRFVSRLTQDTLALVLAGGRGARLDELTDWRAKPAVPFGGLYRIIDFTLSNCVNSGIRKIGILTQYKAHSLIRHIQRGWGFLRGELGEYVEILPAQQRIGEFWYQGTADAVYQCIDIIAAHQPTYVVVLAGDHIYKMDYGLMMAQHVEKAADLTVGCVEVPRETATAFGVMGIDAEDRIVSFDEKPADPPTIPGRPEESLVSMGIYIFRTDFLVEQLRRDARDPDSSHDFGRDIIPSLLAGHRVYAHPFRERQGGPASYWRDVGTVDAFWEANLELTRVTPELNLYDASWPVWTYQEQVPPAKFVFDDEGRRGMAIDAMVCGGCILSGAAVYRSLLFYNVRAEARAEIDDSVLLPEVEVGRDCRIRRAVIDKGCTIPAGTSIGFEPQADAERFRVTPGGVTLVTRKMLGQDPRHAF